MNDPKSGGEVRAERVQSIRLPEEESFLTLERMQCRTRYPDGRVSEVYPIDCVHRRGIDAVAVLLYDTTEEEVRIGVRRALRPILQFRHELPLAVKDKRPYGMVWEAIAGSLEPEDQGEEGVRSRVVAEVWEEAGFRVKPEEVETLGAGFFPSHGQSSEKIHLRAVKVQIARQDRTAGAGVGPAEVGWTEFFGVSKVLEMCRIGEIEDPKVELSVYRFLSR